MFTRVLLSFIEISALYNFMCSVCFQRLDPEYQTLSFFKRLRNVLQC
jgi:hypothetical protein